MRIVLAAALIAFPFLTAADALELCARKVNGTVHVREVCRSNEFKLEPKLAGLAAVGASSTASVRTSRDVTSTTIPSLNVTALHLFDTNDQDVGLVVSADGFSYTLALDNGALMTVFSDNPPTLKVGEPQAAGWSDPGCTGTTYVRDTEISGRGLLQGLFYVDSDVNNFYRVVPDSGPVSVAFGSHRDVSGDCLPGPSTPVGAFVLEPTSVPWTAPLAWPLRARSATE